MMLNKKTEKLLATLDNFHWKAILGEQPYIIVNIRPREAREVEVCFGEDYIQLPLAIDALETMVKVLKELQKGDI